MSKKALAIVGARPQFIKHAPLAKAFQNSSIDYQCVNTGQHYDEKLSKVFFDQLQIPEPEYSLGVGSGSHGEQTGRMLIEIEKVFLAQKPDVVIIFGDTNSTLAGAVAAAKLHIPVAHIEAGLRSFNRKMPEEINRIVADQLSDYLYIPTETAAKNLAAEGFSKEKVLNVGDIMFDSTRLGHSLEFSPTEELKKLSENPFVLVTLHRAENTDSKERLAKLIRVLEKVSKDFPVVFPVHPRTRQRMIDHQLEMPSSIGAIEPVGYQELLYLQSRAKMIATDSGGVQKEAYFSRKRCVTLRDETEWVELVESGWNTLAPPANSEEEILNTVMNGVRNDPPANDPKPYGDGNTSEKIVQHLESVLR